MEIDIKKKWDRIAIAIVLITSVFAFLTGTLSYRKNYSARFKAGLTDHFHRFVKQEYKKDIDKTLTDITRVYEAIFGSDVRYASRGLGRTGIYEGEIFEYKIVRPPLWKTLGVGVLYAVLAFVGMFSGICLLGRGLRRFFSPSPRSE